MKVGDRVPRTLVTSSGETVLLRPAAAEDAAALIRAVDGVAREGAYFLRSRFEVDEEAEQSFLAAAHERGDLVLLAKASGRVVGWVTVFRAKAEFQHHLAELGLGVVGDWRGRGIGTGLMHGALAWAVEHEIEKVKLGVRVGNERALALYRRFGFVEEGYRLRDVKDSGGVYHDVIEMSWFAPSPGTAEGYGSA